MSGSGHHHGRVQLLMLMRLLTHHMRQGLWRMDGGLAERHSEMRCLGQLMIVRGLEREKGGRTGREGRGG